MAVRVQIFEDLQCSDSAAFSRMLDHGLLPKFKDRVVFEHRDFPLAQHDWAWPAAIAARFFHEQAPKLGLEFRRLIMAKQASITPASLEEEIADFATANDISVERARASLSDKRLDELVNKDVQEGSARGVERTPTAFVNGKRFVETFSLEDISKSIEAGLKD